MSGNAHDFLSAGRSRAAGQRQPIHVPAEVRDSNLGTGTQTEGSTALSLPASPEPEPTVRLLDAVMTLREALTLPEPEYRSVFKAGGMPLGFYGIVHGDGGIGKTRELLRMMVLRVLGRPWHCWEPSEEPFRPLFLSLEIGRAAGAKVLEAIVLDVGGTKAWTAVVDQIHILGKPEFLGPLHSGLNAQAQLLELIQRRDANFVLIDSLSEILGGSGGDTPEDYAPSIEMLKSVSRQTNAHLCIIHHNRRLPAGAKSKDAPADQIRGPAAFVNSSRWASAIDMHRDMRRITWHRVSFGPNPPASYFKIDASGIPHDDFVPEGVIGQGEINRARVLGTIPAVGGISRRGIEEATGLSTSAVGEHTKHLVRSGEVNMVGTGSNIRYVLPTSRAPELALPGSVA